MGSIYTCIIDVYPSMYTGIEGDDAIQYLDAEWTLDWILDSQFFSLCAERKQVNCVIFLILSDLNSAYMD